MNQKCPSCGRILKGLGSACWCGWTASTAPAAHAAPPPEVYVPPSPETRARAREAAKAARSFGKAWTRERYLEHWRTMAGDPNRPPRLREFARDALKAMHADIAEESASR